MKKKKLCWVITCIVLTGLIGVVVMWDFGAFDPVPEYRLKITFQGWTGWEEEQPEPVVKVYDSIKKGMVVYEGDSFCDSIVVNKIKDGYIQLKINNSCYIQSEPNSFRPGADPTTILEVPECRKTKITSQTLDAGVHIIFWLELK